MRRLWAASEARALGYGGVSIVARAVGLTRPTITAGLKELGDARQLVSLAPTHRVRRPGAGRPRVTQSDGGLEPALQELVALQRMADATGLKINVCHLPAGTSKWNKIEHRMFCHITRNWRGRPLESLEVVVNLIASTTTTKGLRVRAALDTDEYPTGVKVDDATMAALRMARDKFHGDWSYAIAPHEPRRVKRQPRNIR